MMCEGPADWTWLSRGLVEALQGFIALANGWEPFFGDTKNARRRTFFA
jgi:hypothetical protein